MVYGFVHDERISRRWNTSEGLEELKRRQRYVLRILDQSMGQGTSVRDPGGLHIHIRDDL